MFYLITDSFEHPPDLPIQALAQNDAQTGRANVAQILEPGALTIEGNPFEQLDLECWIPRPIECDLVFLLHFVTRMRQPLGEIPVVGQEEKAFRLGDEPADIKKMRKLGRQKIKDGIARVRVASRRDEAGGFMEDDGARQFELDSTAVHFDEIGLLRLGAEICAHLTVHGHAPGLDQFVTMPARAETGGGEIPI
jgi:hypothetical protein